jgi:peptide/nickel transport system substrate-binding protein
MSKRFARMGWVVMIAVLVVALGILPACGGEGEGEGGPIPYKNDGMFVEETIGLGETADPAAAYDTSAGELIDYVYDFLVDYNYTSSDTFAPNLATSWVWNDTAFTWTFTMRTGVMFQEGGNLTPEDVEYSFERTMIYNRGGGPQWMLFEPLLGCDDYIELVPGMPDEPTDQELIDAFALVDPTVEVAGNTVVFTMVDAAWKLIFLQTIANSWGAILDKEWCVAQGEWNGTAEDVPNHYMVPDGTTYLWDHMNGTGPWKLLEYTPTQNKVQNWTGYWGDPPPFGYIVTKKVTEWTTRKAALLAGDADYVDVPRMYIHELDNITDLNAISGLPQLSVEGFFMVLNISPTSPYIGSGTLDGNGIPGNFFNDTNVRKGFCYAFDYAKFLAEAMLGEGIQPGSPIVQGLYGYNASSPKYSLCLTLAKTLLQTTPTFGNLSTVGFKFIMMYNAGNLVRKAACEILQTNLLAIDPKFQVSIIPMDWKTGILPLIKTKLATCYQIGWGADYPHAANFVVPFMRSTGVFAKYQSYGYPALDAKIDAALTEPDPATQLAKYSEISQIFYDDAPGFMTVQPLGRRYFTKYISGFYFNPMIPGNVGPLYYMSKSAS